MQQWAAVIMLLGDLAGGFHGQSSVVLTILRATSNFSVAVQAVLLVKAVVVEVRPRTLSVFDAAALAPP